MFTKESIPFVKGTCFLLIPNNVHGVAPLVTVTKKTSDKVRKTECFRFDNILNVHKRE